MQTVFETRRARLKVLIAKHGTISALNTALGWDATNPRLSQIQNRSVRSDRGTPYEMGDATAREIEQKLQLATGWMDTPIGLERYDAGQFEQLHRVAEKLAPYQIDQWLEIGETLARSREKLQPTSEVAPDTVAAGASTDTGPALVSSAATRAGGYFDPARTTSNGAVQHDRKQDGKGARTTNRRNR